MDRSGREDERVSIERKPRGGGHFRHEGAEREEMETFRVSFQNTTMDLKRGKKHKQNHCSKKLILRKSFF